MSSTPSHRALGAMTLALGALASSCGRSPAMPHAAVRIVRVEDGKAVPCHCVVEIEDDDEDDDGPSRRPPPVEYVRLSEWQEPESARRAASDIAPDGKDHSRLARMRLFGR